MIPRARLTLPLIGAAAAVFAAVATDARQEGQGTALVSQLAYLKAANAEASDHFACGGSLPGHIARTRGHPWATAVTVAGWVTLICGFALWPVVLIWAYVDVPARKSEAAR